MRICVLHVTTITRFLEIAKPRLTQCMPPLLLTKHNLQYLKERIFQLPQEGVATFYNCISKYSIYDIPELSGSLMVMPPTVSVLTFALFNVNF